MVKVKIICENCGKIFYKSECRLSKSKHHFCCTECYYKYRLDHPYKYVNNRYCKQMEMLLEAAKKRKEQKDTN